LGGLVYEAVLLASLCGPACRSKQPYRAADKEAPSTANLPPVVMPTAADIQSLTVKPEKVALKGLVARINFMSTANLAAGRSPSTLQAKRYEVADEKIVITSTGRVVPLTNGTTTIKATCLKKWIRIPVTAVSCDVDLPINFGNQIVPIFTKLGCNSGGCHE
jgi:hypothetical protein